MGGYFICNGIERLVRMLQIPRRNYVNALTRPSFQKRGSQYTDKACTIRCVRPDHSAVTVTLHYLSDGNAMIKFSLKKQEFFIPVVLLAKALVDTTDREIYDKCLRGDVANTFLSDRLELILRDGKVIENVICVLLLSRASMSNPLYDMDDFRNLGYIPRRSA